ncbi:hypothetical protein CAPTEDRAFT_199140 [Capitella teleta]|uniref:F5/8 type C domain-containing protein n=1 Tax=Capitella teleta TaxID=283909 RepID=R7TQC4_CAPTE|nr:hypothetical protein CAPTEDRAFT_199140 [Capitella teleta]|eukprot:ELT93235.1 hypothetical protein CAPTEDRAFT_199140 [Capitella teleta]
MASRGKVFMCIAICGFGTFIQLLELCDGYCLCPKDTKFIDTNVSNWSMSLLASDQQGQYDALHSPINSSLCWRRKRKPAIATVQNSQQWIQGKFAHQNGCITQIESFGRCGDNGYIKTFTLEYSYNGTKFIDYVDLTLTKKVFKGNRDSLNGALNRLPPKMIRAIRAYPQEKKTSWSWKWELYGCPKEALPLLKARAMSKKETYISCLASSVYLDTLNATTTSLLSDDDHLTCLDLGVVTSYWHALIRFGRFPSGFPIKLIGAGIRCDSRHILVTYPQSASSCGAPSRVCRIQEGLVCEVFCEGGLAKDILDLTIYFRGDLNTRLCEITSDVLNYVV